MCMYLVWEFKNVGFVASDDATVELGSLGKRKCQKHEHQNGTKHGQKPVVLEKRCLIIFLKSFISELPEVP